MQKQSFIIVTLALDEEMIVYFNRLRQLYYPKHCNYLDAHLTLFHKLPYPNTSILDTIETICNCPTFYVQIASLKNMGKGVAFEILSEELSALHQKMQIALDAYLIKKDRQVLWPHITIQNKVSVFKAAGTFNTLQQNFEPFNIKAIGIDVWLYLSGHWQKLSTYNFKV